MVRQAAATASSRLERFTAPQKCFLSIEPPARCSLARLYIGSSPTAAVFAVCKASTRTYSKMLSAFGEIVQPHGCASIIEPRSGPGYQPQDMRCVVTERGQTVDHIEGIDLHVRDWPYVLLSCGLQETRVDSVSARRGTWHQDYSEVHLARGHLHPMLQRSAAGCSSFHGVSVNDFD